MLNISHKQTTAYHPKTNGAVKRLHHCLKDSLHACAAVATWSKELSFVLLGLRAQPREDTGLSPAEAVFGAQIVLPNELLQNFKLSIDAIFKNLPKHCMFLLLLCLGTILAPTCPVSCQPSCSPPPLVWVCRGGPVPPLQPLYDGPYAVCAAAQAPSPSESGHGMRWSPSAVLRLVRQRMSRLAAHLVAADRWARAQAVLPQPSRSCFQTRWYLHLPLLRRRHSTVVEPFSYPARRFLHAWDRRHLHSLHRRCTRPVNGHPPRGWTFDLFSSQLRPELGGSPVESCVRRTLSTLYSICI